jgi:hypothetical protein
MIAGKNLYCEQYALMDNLSAKELLQEAIVAALARGDFRLFAQWTRTEQPYGSQGSTIVADKLLGKFKAAKRGRPGDETSAAVQARIGALCATACRGTNEHERIAMHAWQRRQQRHHLWSQRHTVFTTTFHAVPWNDHSLAPLRQRVQRLTRSFHSPKRT